MAAEWVVTVVVCLLEVGLLYAFVVEGPVFGHSEGGPVWALYIAVICVGAIVIVLTLVYGPGLVERALAYGADKP